jgi:hypothetical protein
MPIPLYDSQFLLYDDLSINKAAQKSIKNYETYVVPYFEKYTDYVNLEKFYNNFEYKQTKGLVLAKYLSLPYFDELVSIFHKQIMLRCEQEDCDELHFFHKTIEYLNKNNIKKLLD